MINNSVKKCCICNNKNIGEFITINDNKYHLCCIEKLQQENNQLKQQRQELRSWLEEETKKGGSSIDLSIRIHTIQEVLNRLEGNNE